MSVRISHSPAMVADRESGPPREVDDNGGRQWESPREA